MKKLYKQTATGSTQVWYQEISENGDSYRTISGKLGGKMVFSEWTTCTQKNIGKANETSLQQQCLLEVESNYKKKLAQGNYKETLDEDLSVDNYFRPMLAKEYGKDYDLWELDCKKGIIYSQPKLDGCVSYDTLINTNIGNIEIGKIVDNKLDCCVLSYNEKNKTLEYKTILNYMCFENEKTTEWFEITLTNNKTIKITGEHPVYLPKLKCWRQVKDLQEEDIVLLNDF